jgi:hypothetical protein
VKKATIFFDGQMVARGTLESGGVWGEYVFVADNSARNKAKKARRARMRNLAKKQRKRMRAKARVVAREADALMGASLAALERLLK